MCWWNSFAQLFGATRNMSIVNKMIEFIDKHNCGDSNKCWHCNVFNDFIIIMTCSNNSINVDFDKYLFNIPAPVQDPKNPKNLILHPFSSFSFEPNRQHDAFEGCN